MHSPLRTVGGRPCEFMYVGKGEVGILKDLFKEIVITFILVTNARSLQHALMSWIRSSGI